jgi:hypothetical protein
MFLPKQKDELLFASQQVKYLHMYAVVVIMQFALNRINIQPHLPPYLCNYRIYFLYYMEREE